MVTNALVERPRYDPVVYIPPSEEPIRQFPVGQTFAARSPQLDASYPYEGSLVIERVDEVYTRTQISIRIQNPSPAPLRNVERIDPQQDSGVSFYTVLMQLTIVAIGVGQIIGDSISRKMGWL